MGVNDFVSDSMLEMYLFESTTLLDQLDDILLESEKSKSLSVEHIDEIFRIMHTIKGSSAMMEFDTIAHVSHKLEDLFFVVRDNGINESYFDELLDLVLSVSDFLKDEINKVQQNQALSAGNEILTDQILNLLERMTQENASVPVAQAPEVAVKKTKPVTKSKTKAAAKSKTEIATKIEMETDESEQKTYHLHVRFSAGCQMENIRAFMLVNKLQTIGTVLATIPEELSSNNEASEIILNNGFYCSFATSLTKEEIQAETKGSLSVDTLTFIKSLPTVERVEKNPEDNVPSEEVSDLPVNADQPNATNDVSAKGKDIKQNLINVDLNKLDVLMDLVGEIVITESMVSGSPDLEGLNLHNFNKASHQLRKLTDELQDIVMSIRMVPIATTFQKMRRIVRDMNKKFSRDVDLILLGEATEVDKTIVDAIMDPLMHLVRNAMDHGIEDTADRIAANKDPSGQIILSAQNVGGDIIISVSDNGRGLDAERILEKAKAKGLLIKPESEYKEREIFNLLTCPGFSMKEAVTEYSGRGVGMDVVKMNIEKIGGTVTIESQKGSGTNVFFKIPLTLAIISSMEIKVGRNVYAIPITNIRESFKSSSGRLIKDPDNNEMIMIRGVCYPIIRLHKIFNIEDGMTNIEDGILLLVDAGNRLACIFTDELVGKHQVVVKPLPSYLRRYDVTSNGITGCTILGDGSISLILDIQGILNQY